MTNLENISIALVQGLTSSNRFVSQAMACIARRHHANSVTLDHIETCFADEAADRRKGVLIRGVLHLSIDDGIAASAEDYSFDAYVSFASGSASLVDLILDDEDETQAA